jgi:hypothetical protein
VLKLKWLLTTPKRLKTKRGVAKVLPELVLFEER